MILAASNGTALGYLARGTGLVSIVRNGRGKMPPVGKTWTKQQMDALLTYLRKNVYKGATPNGG